MNFLNYIIEFYKALNDFTVDMTMTGYLEEDELQRLKYYNTNENE
jgi:hypothetical protein